MADLAPQIFFSDQERALGGRGGSLPRKLRAPQAGGRVLAVPFDAVLPPRGLVTGDVIQLCRIPGGVAVIFVLASWDRAPGGMTSLGVEGAPSRYGHAFGDRLERWYLPRLIVDVETTILATNTGAPWTPEATLSGHFMFVSA